MHNFVFDSDIQIAWGKSWCVFQKYGLYLNVHSVSLQIHYVKNKTCQDSIMTCWLELILETESIQLILKIGIFT